MNPPQVYLCSPSWTLLPPFNFMLQSPSVVILEPKKIKFDSVSTVSPSISHEVMGQMPWSSFSECWALSQLFHAPLSLSSRGFLVPLHFLPQDNHDGVITHLEPDILECEVKWALGNITTNKASGGDGIPVKLFQILKDDAMKVLHSICQQIWKTQQWPQGWKRSVFFPIPKKGNAKECSNYLTIALLSHASKVMLKVLQAKHHQ